MKKITSILLALCLLATASCAFAETISLSVFTNGTTLILEHDGELFVSDVVGSGDDADMKIYSVSDGVNTPVMLAVAPSDVEDTLSLGDLSEEEQLLFAQEVGAIYNDPIITAEVTPSGNAYVMVCSNEESDIDNIVTIYKGFFVELIQYRDDFSALTEADRAFLMDVLYALEFVPAAAE